MKRVLSVLLALYLLVGVVPLDASAAEEKFTVEDGKLIMYTGPGGDVVIPSSVTHIDSEAFKRDFMTHADLRTVTIPSSVQIIDPKVFSDFEDLTKISVDPSNTAYADIDGVLFSKDMKTLIQFPGGKVSANYVIPSSVTDIESYAFAFCEKLSSVVIPQSVTEIESFVFLNCKALKDVTIPNSITAINSYAFEYCTSLTNVTIPSSVMWIGKVAFGSCTKLKSISVASGNSYYADNDGVLFTKNMKELIQFPAGKGSENYIIPDSVTRIEYFAFQGCADLKCVTIPENITEVHDTAFYRCSSLTSVVLLDGVKTIGPSAFCDCTKLASITIPASLTEVKPSAFTRCSSLKDIYYGGSQAQWNRVQIANTVFDNNEYFTSAKVHYNSTGPKPTEPTVGGFSDVKQSAYYADAVLWAVENGITSGIGGGKFAPAQTCKREQIVTFLYRSKGSPQVSITDQFTDMPKSEEFQRAISWAVENNITMGNGKGQFSPEKGCTRAEAMTFIWRAAGRPEPKTEAAFSDMPSSSDFRKAISWAVENNITQGIGNNKFGPNNPCNRGHIVTFLYNAKDL